MVLGRWMDTDGLETLHIFFAQYPRYNTNVCIHQFAFYPTSSAPKIKR